MDGIVKFDLLHDVFTSPNAEQLTHGSPAHDPGLRFVATILPHSQDPDFHVSLAAALLKEDYKGNLLPEIPEMVAGGIAKGLHLRETVPDLAYDPGDQGPEPMGYLENGSFVFFDKQRRLLITETSNRLTALPTLMNMAPRSFWESRFPKIKDGRVIGTDSVLAADVLMSECRKCGGFDPGRVRGRGVYRDNGMIVTNFGGPIPEGATRTYACWLPLDINVSEGSSLDAVPVLKQFQRFNWENPSSATLLLGWAITAPICGVLDWRAHIFVTGSKNTGKTTLIGNLESLLGATAIVLDGSSTEAGIRQKIGPDSRPVILDEFEADSNVSRMKNVVKLARSASSASGQIARGTPEGKALEFNINSTFLFGAITPMAVTAADRSRIVVLGLEKHQSDPKMAEAISLGGASLASMAPKWCGLAVSQIDNILVSIDTLRAVMPPCDSRHARNMATLLSGAWCALNRRAISHDEARALVAEHMAVINELEAAHESDDASDCLNTLLEYRIKDSLMLGTLLAYAKREKFGQAEDRALLNQKLQVYGIKPDKEGGFLIANSHRGLSDVFKGTIWEAGGWNASLRRLPGAEKTKQKRFGNHRAEAVWLPASVIPEEYDDGHKLPVDRRCCRTPFSEGFTLRIQWAKGRV